MKDTPKSFERFYAQTTLDDFERIFKKCLDAYKNSDLFIKCEWEKATPQPDFALELRGLCSVFGGGLDVIKFQIKQHPDDIEVIAECQSENPRVQKFFTELLNTLKKFWEISPSPSIFKEFDYKMRRALRPPTNSNGSGLDKDTETSGNGEILIERKDPKREQQKNKLIELYQKGKTQSECATELYVSVSTIKNLAHEIERQRGIVLKWK